MNIKRDSIFCLLFLAIITITTAANARIITLFSHGMFDTLKQAFIYSKFTQLNEYNVHYLFTTPYFTFNYPDAVIALKVGDYRETSFGQENEIKRLYSAYKRAQKKALKKFNEPSDIILFGLSRGASNQLIFAGTHQLEDVKAIVVESPYYIMSDVIESLMHKYHLGSIPLFYGEYIAELIFGRYKRDGLCPGNCVENIPKNIPILIICSVKDALVPYTSSVNIYKKLIAAGHEHTYIFIADHGHHSRILYDVDGEKYQAITHAFYKKYNLPYDPAIAAQGKDLLALCQPIL